MKDEAVAVGGKNKGNIERQRIIQRLLHAVAHGTAIVFGFQQGDGEVLVVEDVIGPLALAPCHQFAANNNPTLGKKDLAADLGGLVPAGLNQGGGDVFGANIRFAQVFLAHASFLYALRGKVAGGVPVDAKPSPDRPGAVRRAGHDHGRMGECCAPFRSIATAPTPR